MVIAAQQLRENRCLRTASQAQWRLSMVPFRANPPCITHSREGARIVNRLPTGNFIGACASLQRRMV
jgi:hypothetical protein